MRPRSSRPGRRARRAIVPATAVAALLIGAAVLPRTALAQIRWEDPGRGTTLELRGWLQPRYEFAWLPGGEDLSSFYMRRIRLDFQAALMDGRVLLRVLPELRAGFSLRDGFVEYVARPALRIRFGQHQPPFQWQRAVSGVRQHFVERGLPGESFGFPDGRDIGVMVHGRDATRSVSYGIGVYDGAGRNVARSDSRGNMASARVALALLGEIPQDETDFAAFTEPGLSLGAGLQGATRSGVRRWDLWRAPSPARADWLSGTADVHVSWAGLSLTAEGYLRRVLPEPAELEAYTGDAYLLTAGYALLPPRLELVARVSELRWDRADPETRETEWGAGVNLYHRGHDWKTRLQVLGHLSLTPDGFATEMVLIVEHHVQF